MTQEMRDYNAIEAKYEELAAQDRPENTSSDNSVYGLNIDGLQYDGKITALEWLLEEPRSELDVYYKFRQKRDSLVTADQEGSKQSCRMDGWKSILRWVLQCETPEHPHGVYDHVDTLDQSLFNLLERANPDVTFDGDDFPESNEKIDRERLYTQIRIAYQAISDAYMHMIDGPDEDREMLYESDEFDVP